VGLVSTEVPGERIAYIIRVEIIGELRTALATEARCVLQLLVTANVVPSSPMFVTLMMKAIRSSEPPVLKRAQEPHSVASHEAAYFIVTVVKTSNLI
jgi:hypothetical protein